MESRRVPISATLVALVAVLTVSAARIGPIAAAEPAQGQPAAGSPMSHDAKPNAAPAPGFELMKSLVGDWQGTSPDGKPLHTSYKLTSSGSCVEETTAMPEGGEMVTMFHMDGGQLMMTHYCAVGNQPRMRCEAAGHDAKTLTFTMFDATNLPSRDAMHMNKLVIHVDDSTHLTEEWTLHDAGKDTAYMFNYERMKP